MHLSDPKPRCRVRCLVVLFIGSNLLAASWTHSAIAQNEIDAFMQRVLQRREVAWQALSEHVFNERISTEIEGPLAVALGNRVREYSWFVRDGFLVRSPITIDGATVGVDDRNDYERRWLERERERGIAARRTAERGSSVDGAVDTSTAAASPGLAAAGSQATKVSLDMQGAVEREYFLGFRFEPGNYVLAGRETLDGRSVLRIEYYPRKMFAGENRPAFWELGDPGPAAEGGSHDEGRETRGDEAAPERSTDEERVFGFDEHAARKFNKTTLVTLWIDPEIEQIVRIVFDNVGDEFLRVSLLVRVQNVRATMTMHEPIEGVWLPRDIELVASALAATGEYEVTYRRAFSDYKRADVSSGVRFTQPR